MEQKTLIIYWVGCAVSFNKQTQKIAIKPSDILSKANIKLGVLKEENCTEYPARQIGNEYLYQMTAIQKV